MVAIPTLDLDATSLSSAPRPSASDSPSAASRGRQEERSALRQRAFTLYCQGLRAPAISARLHVPERTVRYWLAAARAEIRADTSHSYADQLCDAVEGLREVLLAAWQAYERDVEVDEGLLAGKYDYLKSRRIRRSSPHREPFAESGDQIISETYARPHVSTRGPTHLRLALAVQREIARLLDLYPRGRSSRAPAASPPAKPATPAKSATATSALPRDPAAPQPLPAAISATPAFGASRKTAVSARSASASMASASPVTTRGDDARISARSATAETASRPTGAASCQRPQPGLAADLKPRTAHTTPSAHDSATPALPAFRQLRQLECTPWTGPRGKGN